MGAYTKLPRRPLIYIAATYAGGIAWCYLYAPPFLLVLMLFGIAVIAFISRPIFPILLAALLLFGSLYSHFAFTKTDPLEAYMTDGKGNTPELSGRVLTLHEKAEDYRTLTVLSGGRKILVRVSGAPDAYPPPEELIGRTILFTGEAIFPDTAKNPGGFNYRLHLLSKDIRIIVNARAPAISLANKGKNPLWEVYNKICRAKRAFLARANAILPTEQAALFAGMTFGDKDAIDDETYEAFKRGGAAHILSVSGLHVAMVYAFVSAALGRRKNKRYYTCALACLLLYALLSEFSPSVTRAVLMLTTHIFSKLFGLRYDMLSGVACAGLILLLINPLALFGLGFQLSFLAVLSLAFALPFAERFTGFLNRGTGKRAPKNTLENIHGIQKQEVKNANLLSYLLPMVIIQVFVLPITAFRFQLVSALAIFINIPVIAIASLIVPFGIIVFAISAISTALPALAPITDVLSGIGVSSCGTLEGLMLHIVKAADALPFGSFNVCAPHPFWVLAFYALSYFFISDSFWNLQCKTISIKEARHKAKPSASWMRSQGEEQSETSGTQRLATGLPCCRAFILNAVVAFLRMRSIWGALLAIVLSCVLIAASPVCKRGNAPYTFVDVGQGDCLHIRTKDGKNYLMDGGGSADSNVGESILLPYLLSNGVPELDGVFISHLHTDHFKGIVELSKKMKIKAFYVYEGSAIECEAALREGERPAAPIKVVPVAQGDIVSLGKTGAFAEILFPPRGKIADPDDENKTSLLIRFENQNISALMTGDVGFEGEAELLRSGANPRADILKLGHHGSKYSTSDEFLDETAPYIGIIQVGRNTYGHPTPEVLAKLAERNIPAYRNDKCGAVLFAPAENGISARFVKRDFVSPMLLKAFEREYNRTLP